MFPFTISESQRVNLEIHHLSDLLRSKSEIPAVHCSISHLGDNFEGTYGEGIKIGIKRLGV